MIITGISPLKLNLQQKSPGSYDRMVDIIGVNNKEFEEGGNDEG